MTLVKNEIYELLQGNIDHLTDMRKQSLGPIENAASIPSGHMIPIPFFGDPFEYDRSQVKILTVGLNPSNREFQRGTKEKNWQPRFELQREIETPEQLLLELRKYFELYPYDWFKSFETVLNECDATYGYNSDSKKNRAIHIDVCSPIATNPTWSKLGVQNQPGTKQKTQAAIDVEKKVKDNLTQSGSIFFKRMLSIFEPDLVIASVGWAHLKKIDNAFSDHKSWETIYTKLPRSDVAEVEDKKPCVRGKRVNIDSSEFYFVNGAVRSKPFDLFGAKQQKCAARTIRKKSGLFN